MQEDLYRKPGHSVWKLLVVLTRSSASMNIICGLELDACAVKLETDNTSRPANRSRSIAWKRRDGKTFDSGKTAVESKPICQKIDVSITVKMDKIYSWDVVVGSPVGSSYYLVENLQSRDVPVMSGWGHGTVRTPFTVPLQNAVLEEGFVYEAFISCMVKTLAFEFSATEFGGERTPNYFFPVSTLHKYIYHFVRGELPVRTAWSCDNPVTIPWCAFVRCCYSYHATKQLKVWRHFFQPRGPGESLLSLMMKLRFTFLNVGPLLTFYSITKVPLCNASTVRRIRLNVVQSGPAVCSCSKHS